MVWNPLVPTTKQIVGAGIYPGAESVNVETVTGTFFCITALAQNPAQQRTVLSVVQIRPPVPGSRRKSQLYG